MRGPYPVLVTAPEPTADWGIRHGTSQSSISEGRPRTGGKSMGEWRKDGTVSEFTRKSSFLQQIIFATTLSVATRQMIISDPVGR
jgi:hypothetical protein